MYVLSIQTTFYQKSVQICQYFNSLGSGSGPKRPDTDPDPQHCSCFQKLNIRVHWNEIFMKNKYSNTHSDSTVKSNLFH
jgi:hypothetical protein